MPDMAKHQSGKTISFKWMEKYIWVLPQRLINQQIAIWNERDWNVKDDT